MKRAEHPNVKKAAAAPYTLMADPDPEKAVPGNLVVHENAIASIVRRAIEEVPDVSRLTGSSFVDNIAEIVRSRKIQDRAIAVRFSKGSVSIEISIYVYSGVIIPKVAASMQKAVIDSVTSMTGLRVTAVDVNVRGIDEISESADGSEQA